MRRSPNGGYGPARDSLAAADEPHLLRSRRLDVDLRLGNLEAAGDSGLHGLAVGPDPRLLREQRDIHIGYLPAFVGQPARNFVYKLYAGPVLVSRIGIRKE